MRLTSNSDAQIPVATNQVVHLGRVYNGEEAIRKQLSFGSNARFDKMKRLIDKNDLTLLQALIPTVDTAVPGEVGLTYRDLLRSLLERWRINNKFHANDPSLIASCQMLAALGIFKPEEVEAVVDLPVEPAEVEEEAV